METIKLKSHVEMLAEMQGAGFAIFMHASPKKAYGAESARVSVEGESKDGDKIEVRAGYKDDISIGKAIEDAYIKWRRYIKAVPEFDGRFLIEGKVGEAIDDEMPF